ncbi:hypothetical protein GCM10027168_15650 [Streptomyces capparidis]
MTASGRHRATTHAPKSRSRNDSATGLTVTVLALLGLSGPAWALRGEAAELLFPDRPTSTSVPDVSSPVD